MSIDLRGSTTATLTRRETIVREGWPCAFRSARERVWLLIGVEIDRYIQELPPHRGVSNIAYSWKEIERYSTHAVWEASAWIETVDHAVPTASPSASTKLA